jgi:hypothetical protein
VCLTEHAASSNLDVVQVVLLKDSCVTDKFFSVNGGENNIKNVVMLCV